MVQNNAQLQAWVSTRSVEVFVNVEVGIGVCRASVELVEESFCGMYVVALVQNSLVSGFAAMFMPNKD